MNSPQKLPWPRLPTTPIIPLLAIILPSIIPMVWWLRSILVIISVLLITYLVIQYKWRNIYKFAFIAVSTLILLATVLPEAYKSYRDEPSPEAKMLINLPKPPAYSGKIESIESKVIISGKDHILERSVEIGSSGTILAANTKETFPFIFNNEYSLLVEIIDNKIKVSTK